MSDLALQTKVLAMKRTPVAGFGLGFSNLTHLPSEIGKIRVRTLDISYNYKTLKSLPDELMQLSEPPNYWDTLIVSFDYGAVMSMDNVSDSLKKWLVKYSKVY